MKVKVPLVRVTREEAEREALWMARGQNQVVGGCILLCVRVEKAKGEEVCACGGVRERREYEESR